MSCPSKDSQSSRGNRSIEKVHVGGLVAGSGVGVEVVMDGLQDKARIISRHCLQEVFDRMPVGGMHDDEKGITAVQGTFMGPMFVFCI